MSGFTVYEEYGANYELVQRDINDTQRAINGWPDFDRAIEVLSAHVNPIQTREANRKKAMTVKDLLIKVSIGWSWVFVLFELTRARTANPATPKIRTVVQRPLQANSGLRRSRCQRYNPALACLAEQIVRVD